MQGLAVLFLACLTNKRQQPARFVCEDLARYIGKVIPVARKIVGGWGNSKKLSQRRLEIACVVAHDIRCPVTGASRREGWLRIEKRFMGGVALSVVTVSVGTVVISRVEKDIPGFRGVRIWSAIPAERVCVGPLLEIHRVCVPRHLGVEVECKRICIEALGKQSGAREVTVGASAGTGHALRVIKQRSTHGGTAAELPQSAEQPTCAFEVCFTSLAWDAALLD